MIKKILYAISAVATLFPCISIAAENCSPTEILRDNVQFAQFDQRTAIDYALSTNHQFSSNESKKSNFSYNKRKIFWKFAKRSTAQYRKASFYVYEF